MGFENAGIVLWTPVTYFAQDHFLYRSLYIKPCFNESWSEKMTRKPQFTTKELAVLLEEVGNNQILLFSKFKNTVTNSEKKKKHGMKSHKKLMLLEMGMREAQRKSETSGGTLQVWPNKQVQWWPETEPLQKLLCNSYCNCPQHCSQGKCPAFWGERGGVLLVLLWMKKMTLLMRMMMIMMILQTHIKAESILYFFV